jgi:hypothetical protein
MNFLIAFLGKSHFWHFHFSRGTVRVVKKISRKFQLLQLYFEWPGLKLSKINCLKSFLFHFCEIYHYLSIIHFKTVAFWPFLIILFGTSELKIDPKHLKLFTGPVLYTNYRLIFVWNRFFHNPHRYFFRSIPRLDFFKHFFVQMADKS